MIRYKEKIKNIIEWLYVMLKRGKFDRDRVYVISITTRKKDRTLDQNAFYWVLLNQYADWAHYSKPRLHNEMLGRYGKKTGMLALVPVKDIVEERADVHLQRMGRYKKNKGVECEWCYILKRSSDMNTKEMSNLITGLIQKIEGSEAPIDTDIHHY